MAIAFNEIPLVVNTPGAFIEFDSSRAVKGIQIQPHDALIVANKTSSGTATANVPVLARSYEHAVGLFGASSQAAQMVKEYKNQDRLTPCWVIPLADAGAGVASISTWTITGPATAGGEIAFYISGRRFVVSVDSGDSAADIETAAAASAGELTNLPATITAPGGGVLTATAKHAAAFTSQIKLGYCLSPGETLPAGVGITVAYGTAGSGDADHDDAVTAMDETQYNTIAVGVYTAAEITKMIIELESRDDGMRQIEGVMFGAALDSQADLTTYSANFNSSSFVCVGGEESALLPTPWELAAQAAGMSAYRAQVDPARHLSGQSFSGFSAAPRGSRFTRAERDTLIGGGISTVVAASDGRMLLERFVTTRTTNSQSLADLALFDLTTVRTLHAIRYTIRARISSKFAQFKLADDGSPPRPKVVTPTVIRAELIALFREWYDLGWVENPDQYKEDLVVERNGSDVNRVDAIIPPDIINSFYVFAGQIQFLR